MGAMEVHRFDATLPNLALELQVKILQDLGLGDLTRCTRVCKVLRRLITSEVALQYKMELSRAGMVDGPAKVPLTVKLEKLRARNAARDTGFPFHILTQPRSRRGSVSFPGGVFFRFEFEGLETSDGGMWTLYRPAWPKADTYGGLEHISISLTNLGVLSPMSSSSCHASPCAVNPEEDLVVFVQGRSPPDQTIQCVLFNISQNKVMDSSWQTQLAFSDIAPPVWDLVQSVGDLLSWSRINTFYSAGPGELRVVNWKTGAIVWRSRWPMSGRCLLLDQSHVMVVDHRGLFLYEFDPHMVPSMPPDLATDDNCLLHLEFPTLGVSETDIMFLQSHEPGSRYFKNDRPFFREDPDIAVLTVYFSCLYDRGVEDLLLVIPLATIRTRLALLSQSRVPDPQAARKVPWSEWGPDGTRLLKLARQPMNIACLGSRVAISLATRSGLSRDVYIVDVRPHSEKQSFGGGAQDVPIALGAPEGAIDASDTISGLASFAEAVTTRLPYRMTYVNACVSGDAAELMDPGSLTHEGIIFTVSRPG
ncbi:hypothetical protein C8T65DRAFT_657326 [Cerioporus squamosus]|nr:hypothetical protein C8T65DRAFT_657326 [Cerioporus squamosus]